MRILPGRSGNGRPDAKHAADGGRQTEAERRRLVGVFFRTLDDRTEEGLVVWGPAQTIEDELGHRHGVELLEALAQHPDLAELLVGEEELLPARAAHLDVDGREGAPLLELAVEVQLHVAGTLELLIDDVIHPAARIDERRGDDRQAPTLLDLPRRAEEPLRAVQRGRVQAPGERAPRRRD